MIEPTLPSLGDLAADDALSVHQRCSRFEAAWKSWQQGGARPSLEDWLVDGPAAVRSVLLGELLQLDLEYRRSKARERPVLADYLGRFRADEPLLRRVWPEPAGNEDGPSSDSTRAPLTAHGGIDDTDERTPPAAAPLQRSRSGSVPTAVGCYEILAEVAVGGMGVVYKARHQNDGAIVALKMMRPDVVGSAEQAQRFHREILAAARLHHDNIVPILDVGWHDGKPFYTMPFRASNLGKLQKQPTRDIKALVAVIEKVARGIQHAHEQNVLHRDLKPGNVLLDERDEPAVTDFGLAKLHDSDLELTRPGTVMGTWPYMSPEQAAGRTRDLGPPTDVWALGVMLYELLAGQRPFVGEDVNELQERIQAAKPPPLHMLRPEVPPELAAIVHRCLQKKPARRYISAAAFADDLRRWQRGERLPRPWPVRRIAVALLAILLVAGGAAFMLRPDRPEPVREQEKDLPTRLVLIGDEGPPKTLNWSVGGKFATVLDAQPGQLFSVQSTQRSMLELLSVPPWPEYVLEAEVQHWDSKKSGGTAGVFLAHSQYQSKQGVLHSFTALCFADIGQYAGQHTLSTFRYPDDPAAVPPFSFPAPGKVLFDRPAMGQMEWRKIAVRVTAKDVQAYWQEKSFASTTVRELEARTARVFDGFREVHANFRPNGGIGVFVANGNATFRRVVIRPAEPLP